MNYCEHKEPEGYCPFCARDQYKGEIEAQHNQIAELIADRDGLEAAYKELRKQFDAMVEVERLRLVFEYYAAHENPVGVLAFNAWQAAREAAFNETK